MSFVYNREYLEMSDRKMIQLAPYFVLKEPSVVESSMLDRLSAGDFFLHITGPNTPKFIYLIDRFAALFKNGLKVYIPAHLIILLLRLRSKKEKKSELLRKYFIGVLRSTLFVAFFASSIPAARITPILYGIFNRKMGSWSGFTISFIFSCFVFIESPNRWSDIALYVLGQWFEAYPKSLVKRRYAPVVAHAEKIMMAAAIGLMTWLTFAHDRQIAERKNKVAQAIEFLIGNKESFEKTLKSNTKNQDKD